MGIVNWIAVVVAAIAGMVIGMIWYSYPVFGKKWMKYIGLTKSDMKKAKKQGMAGEMITMFIALIIASFVLAYFIGLIGVRTVNGGLLSGFLVWIGFIATSSIGGVLWEKKPIGLWVLNNVHWLIVTLVMGIILAVWV